MLKEKQIVENKITKPGVSFEEVEAILFKDKEFADEYERLKPKYEAISRIIEKKIK